MSNLIFSVSSESNTPAKSLIRARNFSFVIDEPVELGGSDEAANPVEYLLGSLAGCLNVVAHLVAKEQNIHLDGLRIEIDGDLDPNRLFGKSLISRAGFQNINIKLLPKTSEKIEALQKWQKEIEDRCPIKDNLLNLTPVAISVIPQFV